MCIALKAMSVKFPNKWEVGFNKEMEHGKGPLFDITAAFWQTSEIHEKQVKMD